MSECLCVCVCSVIVDFTGSSFKWWLVLIVVVAVGRRSKEGSMLDNCIPERREKEGGDEKENRNRT